MNHQTFFQIIQQHGASFVIDKLQPFVTIARQQRIEQVLKQRIHSIQIAVEAPADILNALAIVRTAEVLGVTRVFIIQPEHKAKQLRGITQGAHEWVNIQYQTSLEEFTNQLKQYSIKLAGACIESEMALEQIPLDEPICLLFGNERRGLSAQAKHACDYLYKIPMNGMTESLNLSVAAGISLYETLKRKRHQLQQKGDFDTSQLMTHQAWYYLNSVNTKLVAGLFPTEISL